MTLSRERLQEVVLELVSRPGHEKVRALIYELLVYGLGANSTEIQFERPLPEVHGRLDALLGQTVFEFKRDLRRERRVAEEELGRYLPQRERETGERFIGIATDGADYIPFELEGGRLIACPGYQASAGDAAGLLLWLDAAVSLQPSLIPDPGTVRVELGRGSLAHRRAMAGLRSLWMRLRTHAGVALKRQLWADLIAVVYGSRIDADELFLQHTYLTIVAKTLAVRVLSIDLPDPADLLSGRPFQQAGIAGAVESDFFDWVLEDPEGYDLVQRIARQVARFRLANVGHDVLKELYESLVDPIERRDLGDYYTPKWLAERICRDAIEHPLEQRVLDPACGSGTFVFEAVRRCLAAAEDARLTPAEALATCLDHVFGIDVHPVAVIVSRVAYLLALGDECLQERTDHIALPVYLGDALQWNTEQIYAHLDVVVRVPDGPDLYFPDSLAKEPARFDDTVSTMMDLAAQGASDESLRAWLDRMGGLDEADIDILVATYGHLRELDREGRGQVWGYVIRNLSRPLWLSSGGQHVDVIVGNPPWMSYRHMSQAVRERFQRECRKRRLWSGGRLASHTDLASYFFVRAAELYLRRDGLIAFVMPYGALNRAPYARFRTGKYATVEVRFDRAWALDEKVGPLFPLPSAVLFARRQRSGPLPANVSSFSGRLTRRDETLQQAEAALTVRQTSWPGRTGASRNTPYRRVFRQGATMVPRRLCVVDTVDTGRLGGNAALPLVESRIGRLDKFPWNEAPPLRCAVEARFLRPLYLGESVAPFRVVKAQRAVVPWDEVNDDLLDAAHAQERGYPGLAEWLAMAEATWNRHRRSSLSLIRRWDYMDGLSTQMPPAPIRVVYAKSGQMLAAAIIEDNQAIIDHKLYWAPFRRHSEALYVAALLNSDVVRSRIDAMQSRGKWGVRDIDKLVFDLPIPSFDPLDPLHREVMQAALEAERIADEVLLPKNVNFISARRMVRRAIAESGVAQCLDELVAHLLDLA